MTQTHDSDRRTASDVLRQPDAYSLAEFLAGRFGASTIVEIGYRSGHTLTAPGGIGRIYNVRAHHRVLVEERWIDASLRAPRDLSLTTRALSRSIVLCAGVVERLSDPTRLLMLLSRLSRVACATIVTAPDRRWSSAEFEELLNRHGCHPTLIGLTAGDERSQEKDTIIAVVDRSNGERGRRTPEDFRPLAVLATYNDRDIAPQVIGRLLNDGIDVHILDNWSTDGTFEAILRLEASCGGLFVERFPAEGATPYFEWTSILRRKEEIALAHPGRWIIHHDSDEIRSSPWRDVSLRAGLNIAERMGFNAIDFTVCEFRPVGDPFSIGTDPETRLRRFEFGTRRDHFIQIKAWRQPTVGVDLAGSGGHEARFAGRRIFPYKFLLKHYSLRGPEQAGRKIFMERKERFSPIERARGWHVQYDGWKAGRPCVWNASELIEFDEEDTRRRFLTELIAGIGIVR